jgi:hypothetical protein
VGEDAQRKFVFLGSRLRWAAFISSTYLDASLAGDTSESRGLLCPRASVARATARVSSRESRVDHVQQRLFFVDKANSRLWTTHMLHTPAAQVQGTGHFTSKYKYHSTSLSYAQHAI